MIRVGLIGYGKAGQAVARVLQEEAQIELAWIAKRSADTATVMLSGQELPVMGLETQNLSIWMDAYPVDALVDFSNSQSIYLYADEVCRRQLMLVSAISSYGEPEMACIQRLSEHARVMCSPNITLGINFLMLAAHLLRSIAPLADVAILESHFRDKPEISGTARKIAERLAVDDECITSLRLGGIVGNHEVIFGFPYQTVRLSHESIRREAFGTGVAFALNELAAQPHAGLYTFEDLLMKKVRHQLLQGEPILT